MDTLGTKLSAARKKRKLSPSEAAKGTRIKVQHIEAIEADDFSSIAAPTYAKGFIRIYAEFLGMNPEPLIEEYMATHAPKPRASLIPEEPQPPKGPAKQRQPIQWPTLPKIDWRAWVEKIGVKDAWARIRQIRWQPTPAMQRAGLGGLGLLVVVLLVVQCARREPAPPPAASETPTEIAPVEVQREEPMTEPQPTVERRSLPVIEALPEPYVE